MSEKRDRKPLLEALVGRIDGYDILAEIAGEKEVGREEKREERPADTISQLMSSLPMLMVLPAVLPLLQQTLSQTLSSSTVNVKVESATSIIPIEISASTAIVPIEIKASTVTLNINIVSSQTTLNTYITNSQLNVNITNTVLTVNANITNATLNVNITNQVVQTGIPKTCLALDGVNDGIKVPRSSSIEPSTITIITKIYVTARRSYPARIVDKDSSTGGYLLMIQSDPDNRIAFQIKDSAGGTSAVLSASPVPLNTWLTIAAVYDGSTLYIYINGELSNSFATTRVLAAGTADLWIGNRFALDRCLPGYFSHLLIYNRALTANEIKCMVDNVYSPIPSGLVLWLKMDEGSGTTVYDSSGYNNNGTIYGATWVSSAGSAPTAINVNITASQVTFNVNVTNSSLNVNATIVGNADVIITGQSIGVSILGTYENLAGRDFTVVGEYVGTVGAGAQNATIVDRNNDTGSTVLIEGFSVMCRPAFDSYVFVGKLFAELLIDGTSIGAVTITGEKMSDSFVLLRAIRVASNSNIKVVASNFGTTPVYVRCVVYGYY